MYNLFIISIALVAATIFITATQAQQGTLDIPPGNIAFMGIHGFGGFNYLCENSKYKLTDGFGSLRQWNNPNNNLGTFHVNQLPNSDQINLLIGMNDSTVTFKQDATRQSINSDSIPNAKYSVIQPTENTGPLTGVTFAQSTNTQSDPLPISGCINGDIITISVKTDFIFYKAEFSPSTSTIPPSTFTIQTITEPSTPTIPPSTYTIQTITEPSTPTIPPTTSTISQTGSSYSQPTEPVNLPSAITVPDSNVEQFRVNGMGYYTYTCLNSLWVPTNMFGKLFQIDDPSILVGDLFVSTIPDPDGKAQIVLEVNDSKATLKLVSAAASESYMGVSRALFESTATTPGSLEKVTYVQRLSTVGGVMSKEPCRTSDADITVPFSAVFAFFVSSQ